MAKDYLTDKDINNIITRANRIAKYFAPVESGNLRYNAISVIRLPQGFKVKWDGLIAHYIGFVNEGTDFMVARKFVELAIMTIDEMISDYINEHWQADWKAYIRRARYDDTKYENNERLFALREFRRHESLMKAKGVSVT